MKRWHFNPHGGGNTIPLTVKNSTDTSAEAYAKQQKWYSKFQLRLRYKGQFCYLDARENNSDKDYFPIGRLRYFREDEWSLAFYTYSNEKYSQCFMVNGELGTIEHGISICSVYLTQSM